MSAFGVSADSKRTYRHVRQTDMRRAISRSRYSETEAESRTCARMMAKIARRAHVAPATSRDAYRVVIDGRF